MLVVQLANFHSPTSGGLRTALDQLSRNYARRGVDVVRVVPGATSNDVLVLGGPGRPATIEEWQTRGRRLPRSGGYRVITDRRRLVERLVELRPDVIELSDKTTLLPVAAELRRSLGTPVVLLTHERLDAILDVRLPRRVDRVSVADRWNRRLLRHADAVVAASEFAADEFTRIGAARVLRVPLGVDLDVMHPACDTSTTGRRAPLEHRTTPFRIVCLGRLSAEKHPATAIEALRHLRWLGIDAELLMVGDGPERTALERTAAALPVTFTGHIGDRTIVAALLRDADVAIAPCPIESFGLAALEAMACGTPVVVPDRGALPELVARGCGLVVPDSPPAFAEAVVELIEGDRELQRRRTAEHASTFTWARTSDRMLDLFDRLVEERRLRHTRPTDGRELAGV